MLDMAIQIPHPKPTMSLILAACPNSFSSKAKHATKKIPRSTEGSTKASSLPSHLKYEKKPLTSDRAHYESYRQLVKRRSLEVELMMGPEDVDSYAVDWPNGSHSEGAQFIAKDSRSTSENAADAHNESSPRRPAYWPEVQSMSEKDLPD